MGFGHRVYKNYDPRARIIKQVAYEVFEVTGKDPLLDIALELERIALEDEYFVKRRLYPNVDFYSGIIYQAMRFPVDMFPVMFAIPRTSGWLAQWVELLEDQDQKIARPRQIYLGHRTRDYVPIEQKTVADRQINRFNPDLGYFEHFGGDLFEELCADCAGDVKRIHAWIELDDIRAHHFPLQPLNQIDRLPRR